MADYNVKYTDRSKAPIKIPELEVNDTALDLTLFGRINPEYGEKLDEDLLNLLENFSCPEDPASTDYETAYPDLTQTVNELLTKPTNGQLWYNSTRYMVYAWDGIKWKVIPLRENYAANWGSIMHGSQLPKPVGAVTGHVFDYADCIWSVAPAAVTNKMGSLTCTTDAQANVTMEYRVSGTSIIIPGLANYLIIAIRGNYNAGTLIPPPNLTPTPSVTVSVTPAPTMTPTPSPTPTITATVTPSVTPAPSNTPAPSYSPTPTPTRAPSNTPSPSSTPAPSQTPTPSVTPSQQGTWEWSFAGSWAGQESAPCRPDDLDTGGAMDYLTQYFIDSPCNPAIAGAYIQVNFCDRGSPNSIGWIAYECVIV